VSPFLFVLNVLLCVWGGECEYSLLGVNGKLCGKHVIQKMDVERQVFPNPDIPGVIP